MIVYAFNFNPFYAGDIKNIYNKIWKLYKEGNGMRIKNWIDSFSE